MEIRHQVEMTMTQKRKRSLALTPAQAFKLYSNDLSDYEHGEILEYPEIYCTGAPDKKIRKNSGITMDMTMTVGIIVS